MRAKKHTASLGLLLLGLLVSACNSYVVTNNSPDYAARVGLRIPGRSGLTTGTINKADAFSTIISSGGAYGVAVLPNQQYSDELNSLKDTYGKVFGTSGLSAEQAKAVAKKMILLKDQIDQLSNSGVGCRGTAQSDNDVLANINWDKAQNKWTISCRTVKSKSSGGLFGP